MSTTSRRGFTLVEILVAGALTLTFLGILVNLMFKVSGTLHKTAIIAELQQTSHLVASRISGFAHRCDDGGATFLVDTNQSALAFHPVQDVSPSARKMYDPHVTVFGWSAVAQTLSVFHSDDFPADDRYQPRKLGPDAIRQLLLGTVKSVLSRDLQSLKLTSPDSNFPVLMTLRFVRNAPGVGPQAIVLERCLVLRNVV